MATLQGPDGTAVNPDDLGNFQDIEKQFAVKVVQHLETYWTLLENIRGSQLKLTKMDDDIYADFKETFPDFDPAKPLIEDEMKSKEGKEAWRNWMLKYEKKIEDFNSGTMLRADPKTEYSQDNTIFAMRMQFYGIEIARNRAGLNDWVFYEKHPELKPKD